MRRPLTACAVAFGVLSVPASIDVSAAAAAPGPSTVLTQEHTVHILNEPPASEVNVPTLTSAQPPLGVALVVGAAVVSPVLAWRAAHRGGRR